MISCSEPCLTSFCGGNEVSGLELKMSKVTDIAEKENRELMSDQVMTMESELILCLFVECCSHLTNIQNLWLLW